MPHPDKLYRHVMPNGEVIWCKGEQPGALDSVEVDRTPGPHDEWDPATKKLKVNTKAKAKDEKRAKMKAMDPADLMEIIEDLQRRVAALENK